MNDSLKLNLTRIAPTPSGFLHLGNVLSFALTTVIARQSGARVLLRIDDLDQLRVRKDYIQDIFDTLQFLGISWDEGPRNYQEFENRFSQTHRLTLYEQALAKLRDKNAVFACTCSRARVLTDNPEGIYPGTCRDKGIPLDAPNACWRLRTDKRVLTVKTIHDQHLTAVLPDNLKDFIVRKKDGQPAYQLSSLVDDLYWKVDLIVRGEDLWPSTLAQLYLASLLNETCFGNALFFHHPLFTGDDGQKFSKSAGDTSIQFLRQSGKTAVEILAKITEMARQGQPQTGWQPVLRLLGLFKPDIP